MNLVLFIDYANLYTNIQRSYNFNYKKDREKIEDKICECINKTCDYVKTLYKDKTVNVIERIAYVLPDKCYGDIGKNQPNEKLYQKAKIRVKRVKEERRTKTAIMKGMEQSRNDDAELGRGVIDVVKCNGIDGVIVISNDGDFENLARQVIGYGKYYWCGSYEALNIYRKTRVDNKKKEKQMRIRCSHKLKIISDKVIPLYDILEDNDEGEILDPEGIIEVIESIEKGGISGPRIEIYKDKKMIVSYPITKRSISIGRRSLTRKHLPDIDLTEFDGEKIVSRQHAIIHKIGPKIVFSICPECSSNTWYKTQPKMRGSSFILEQKKAVVLGKDNGFILFYNED